MVTITVGEAKTHLAYSRAAAEALLERLAMLPQSGSVVAIGPKPVPVPFAKCATIAREHLIVSDYVQGLQDIIQWLTDLGDRLNVPEGRAFTEESIP